MQYIPSGVTYAGDIERGEFVCYEIKSCKEDLYSGHGLRFYGDKNYIVTTMSCYKDILKDGHKFVNYLKENYPDSDTSFGIMVLVPDHIDLRDSSALHDEFENPTLLNAIIGNYGQLRIAIKEEEKEEQQNYYSVC